MDRELVGRVREALADDVGPPTPGRVAAAVRAAGVVVGGAGLLDVVDAVQAELLGAGPLQQLLADPDVTDVLVNGVAGVWVDRGTGLQRASSTSATPTRCGAWRSGWPPSPAGGWTTRRRGWTPGCRTASGCTPCCRRSSRAPPTSACASRVGARCPSTDLVAAGTVPPDWEAVLRALVAARAAYLVTGGTGAGKTTLLAALLALVPAAERIVVVEDAAELRVDHPHVVRLEGRAANVEGAGQVSMTDLVRQALRMRPDRLVVGEVRGAEVRELLAALNTGHEGGCGTVHANTSSDVPARLGGAGGAGRPRPGGGRGPGRQRDGGGGPHAAPGGRRRVIELGSVLTGRAGLQVVPALAVDPAGQTTAGPGWPALADRLGLT